MRRIVCLEIIFLPKMAEVCPGFAGDIPMVIDDKTSVFIEVFDDLLKNLPLKKIDLL